MAWLEDDFHHFGIEMRHDGERVIAVEGQAIRFPQNSCPGALGILQEAVGMRLNKRSTALGQRTNMRMNCTHLFDLLGLAIAHAACGREHRRYDVVVPDRELLDASSTASRLNSYTEPKLYRDGELVMAWEVLGNDITGPEAYAGLSLGRGFRQWTESQTVEEAEAAQILRRTMLIALGRLVDYRSLSPEIVKATEGACYSFQPDIVRHSSHTVNMRRDYSENPEGLLQNIARK